ncbi:GNAT family N-acetyltransferase [Halopenitus sp. H-Gu1]|uniref:GNAT family N-acetyltransferase n=1 Tax=Halopenitus sp. H-Gu1 TaxID=3242697 RepID=UPI00359E3343
MTRNVEERRIPPGDDAHLAQAWELKERIRRSDGVLKQARAYFGTEYRQRTVYLLLFPNDQEEVVAFAVIHEDGYLSLFGVAPEHRRQGLGTRLIEALVDDYDTITLHTRASNRGAIEFYKHAGFTVQRRIQNYYPDGTDALLFRLERATPN